MSTLMAARLLFAGLIMMAGTFYTFSWQINSGASLAQARTVALTTMVIFQMFHVFNSRAEMKSVFRTPILSNRFLFFSVLAAFGAHLAAIYLPALQFVFRTTPLNLTHWLVMSATASSVLFGFEAEKAFRRRKDGARHSTY